MGWTKAFRKSHGKEMAVDATFDFERRRNRPVKYDRALMTKTLMIMQRVQEIRAAREDRFYKARMKDKKRLEKERAQKVIASGLDLVTASLAPERRKLEEVRVGKVRDERKETAGGGLAFGAGAGGLSFDFSGFGDAAATVPALSARKPAAKMEEDDDGKAKSNGASSKAKTKAKAKSAGSGKGSKSAKSSAKGSGAVAQGSVKKSQKAASKKKTSKKTGTAAGRKLAMDED